VTLPRIKVSNRSGCAIRFLLRVLFLQSSGEPLACHDGRTLSGGGPGPGQRCTRGAAAAHQHGHLDRWSPEARFALRVVSLGRVLRLGVGYPMGPGGSHRWDCLGWPP
jgi:hypothetical protein